MICNTHVENPFVRENPFPGMAVDQRPLPAFSSVRDRLPSPVWADHSDAIECCWRAWELAFGNLRAPTQGTGFVSNFIDTAFNGCLFMWDSAFILMFGRGPCRDMGTRTKGDPAGRRPGR